jgi:hypothetical protein
VINVALKALPEAVPREKTTPRPGTLISPAYRERIRGLSNRICRRYLGNAMVDLSPDERAQIRSQQCFFRATSDIPGYGRFYSADARFPCSVAVPGTPHFEYNRWDEQHLGVTFNIRGEEDVAVFREDLNDSLAYGEDEVDYARRFERDSYATEMSSKARIRPRIGRVAGFTAHRVDYANGWQRTFFIDSGRIMWNIHNRGIDNQTYARIVSSFRFLPPGYFREITDLVKTDRNGKASGSGTTPVLPTDVTAPKPRVDSRTPPRRRRALVIGLVGLLVAGGTTAGILLSHRQSAGPSAFYGAVSPDGKLIASAEESDVYIWNVATGKVTTTISDDSQIREIAFSPDGQTVAVSTVLSVAIWDIKTGEVKENIPTQYPYGISYSPDGETLALADYQSLVLWDVASNRATAKFTATVTGSAYVEALWTAFSPDGKTVAVSYTIDNTPYPVVELWDVSTKRVVASIASVPSGNGGGVLAFSPDGRTLVVSDRGTIFYLWNVSSRPAPALQATLSPTMSSGDNKNSLSEGSTTYSPDGKTLATAGWPNDGASIWDAATGNQIVKLTAPDSSRVDALAYTPNGKTLVTFNDDGKIYSWNIATHNITTTFTDPS